jgi:hypothetical protein
MDPRRASRLVERPAVGEGGEGFYVARSGSKFDLLAILGGILGRTDSRPLGFVYERLCLSTADGAGTRRSLLKYQSTVFNSIKWRHLRQHSFDSHVETLPGT